MRSNKIVSFAMAAIMAVSAMVGSAAPAFAAKTDNSKVSAARIWNGKADKSWFTGEKDTYNISTAEQLAGFAQLVQDGADEGQFGGITINLTNDIILNDTTNWKNWTVENPPANNWDPIGAIGGPVWGYRPFAGVFNGNGHTISGMFCDVAEEAGLFCYVSSAVITNVHLEKCVAFTYTNSFEKGGVGTLCGVAENSYFENCEANDAIIVSRGTRWAAAGGLVGATESVNNVAVLSYALLLGMGILVNPIIWFDPDVDTKSSMYGTYFVNCKVENIDARVENTAYDYTAAGILGAARHPAAFYNCIAANCKISTWSGGYGGICGGFFDRGGQEVEHIIKQCYIYNCKKTDKNVVKRADLNDVKNLTKSEMTSSKYAKKLGKAFRAVKNGIPELKSTNKYPVKIVLKGEKANIRWSSVSGAKKYIVYLKKSSGKYEPISTVTDTKTTLQNIKKGKTYNLMIRAQLSDGSYKDIGGKFALKA